MFAPGLISTLLLLIPISLIEAYYFKRRFQYGFKKCTWTAIKANLSSTVVGIPVILVLRILVAIIVTFIVDKVCPDCTKTVVRPNYFNYSMEVLSGIAMPKPKHDPYYQEQYMMWGFFVFEIIVAYFVSVYWERRTLLKDFADKSKAELTNASFKANGMSYVFLIAVMAVAGFYLMGLSPREPKQPEKMTRIVLAETEKAVEMFYRDCKRVPVSLDELLKPPSECEAQPYLKRLHSDGWGTPLTFEQRGHGVSIISLGADRKTGGEGSDADMVEHWTPDVKSELPTKPLFPTGEKNEKK
jgi:hypothetical protein